uniref:NADP-dependent oxidoreductase domain-containing protein n=1 Tax=Alexandrium catenella TaxID=2925 RepID=A0A7S1LXG2_ALECA
MTRRFLAAGGREIDTARIYSGGDTEPMLGEVLRSPEVRGAAYRLATKAHPSQPGGLSATGIRAQLKASLEALRAERVDVLYLHQPDPEHNLTESLACVHSLIEEGKVGQLGLSNYSALEMERCCSLCEAEGWTRPSFFQGLYNPLNRMAEEELLPVLRRHEVSFIAFNPLAAGLLTGKHHQGTEVMPGRFKGNPNYLPRFYTDANFKALAKIREACEAHGLPLVAATYAWLLRHSRLDAGLRDGLLLGCSGEAQLEENLAACRSAEELPAEVLAAFNGAWDLCREGAFPYWRSYSKDQPGRESLHPGASYEAGKK